MRGSLPELIDFYAEHGDDERFEILAFHDASVESLEQLDAELASRKIPEKLWKGRELPFPVLLDPSGKTLEQFEIRAFPTMLLVDPEGRFVGLTHGVGALRARLGLTDAGDAAQGR